MNGLEITVDDVAAFLDARGWLNGNEFRAHRDGLARDFYRLLARVYVRPAP